MSLCDVVLQAATKHLRFVKPSGNDNIGGPCPFHKGGEEAHPSFFINLNTGLFFCHACGEKGTFPQFLRKLGESAQKIDLALELSKQAEVKKPVKPTDLGGQHFLKESLLGIFDYCPIGLVKDGFDEDLLHKLDVGFDKEYERITFPIRNVYGRLVGFNGRSVTGEFPRYKVYKKQDLLRFADTSDSESVAQYKDYDIKNHHFLWNMHNVYPLLFYGKLDTLIIVEGYKACIWLLQQGLDNTVALQGSRMSAVQEATVYKCSKNVFMFLDNNKAGKEGTLDTGKRLVCKGFNVWVCSYPEEMEESAQPDNLTKEELIASLDAALPFNKWRNRYGIHTRA